jgi:hypothetical protein
VLVRLTETGPVLLTIDAINYAGQRDPDTRTVAGYDTDEASTRAVRVNYATLWRMRAFGS